MCRECVGRLTNVRVKAGMCVPACVCEGSKSLSKGGDKSFFFAVNFNLKRSPFDFAQGTPSTSLRDRDFCAVMCDFFAKKIPSKLKLNFLRKKFTHYLLLDGPERSRGAIISNNGLVIRSFLKIRNSII